MINYELINSIFSLVADHLQAQHSAIKMLHSRVRLILDYVKAAQKGEVPVCHEALRLAYSLSHRLPVIQRDRFEKDFNAVSYFIFSFFHGTKFCFYILISLIFFLLTAMRRRQSNHLLGNDHKRMRRSSSIYLSL